MAHQYSFGVPSLIIWISHIAIGLFLLYIGRMALNGNKLSRNVALTLAVIGSLAATYHIHLMLYDTFFNNNHKEGYYASRIH